MITNQKNFKKMKKIVKFFAIAAVMFGFSSGIFAQTTASATASAVIIAPLSITQSANLHFGVIWRGTTAGVVTVSPANVRSSTGGVTLSGLAPANTAAAFTITGEPTRAITITIPTTDVTITDGTNNMIVNNFQSTPASGTYTLAGATTTLNVGADLNVGANQASGTYTGTFNVSVNYN